MSRVPNRFIDPAGNLATYDWPLNHEEEGAFGKARTIEHGANTGGTGLIKQQSDDSPMEIEIEGTILEQDHYAAMWEWFALCESQTIYFRDFASQKFEVQITEFQPTRKRTIWNSRGGTTNRLHFWKYSMKFEVYKFISGVLDDVDVSP